MTDTADATIDSHDATTVETHITTCTLDCPDACSLAVTVTDGRITKVDAGPGNPLTDGWICAKVKRHARRVYSPDRVMTPLIRTGPKGAGQFRPASWDEALELVAERMQAAFAEVGPEAVVAFTYNSSAAVLEANSLTDACFASLGTTSAAHTICAATVTASWVSVFGSMVSADPVDVADSRLIVVWGANPTVSNTHFPPLVRRATDAGAELVVIDPRRTPMAKRADQHLAVRPGTDVALALAIANRWADTGRIDRAFVEAHAEGADELLAAAAEWPVARAAVVCGIGADQIEWLADRWAATAATMLRIGWGQERNSNGGAACRAILALPVLAGTFTVPGSGVIYATGVADVKPQRRWPESARRGARSGERPEVNMHQIGRWLAPDAGTPYRVLFVQGANPALMCPDTAAVDRALARNDVFTVVHDQVLTDTTRYADVVLPATTSFEIDDVATSYGTFMVQPVRAVIDRVGEARSNDEVGVGLARALGLVGDDGGPWTAPPVTAAVADTGPRPAASHRQFEGSLPHDGRARLVDPVEGPPRYVPVTAAEPLTLISPASSNMVNSVFGEFQSPTPVIRLHPDDAAARRLTAGQPVRVFNAQGAITVDLAVSDETRPGVAVIPKGIWRRNFTAPTVGGVEPDGGGDGIGRVGGATGTNVLTPATGDPLAQGACFNDTRVEVEAVPDGR
ncbi:MAG: molybdopterin-dependent oxidoreductase [Acidimicrobiales bacterium]